MMQKQKKPSAEQVKNWEETAAVFEDKAKALKIMTASRTLSASERRRMFGPGKTKQISVRLPEEDLEAVKEIAEANSRPYQQLVVIAVQQFLDRIAEQEGKKNSEDVA